MLSFESMRKVYLISTDVYCLITTFDRSLPSRLWICLEFPKICKISRKGHLAVHKDWTDKTDWTFVFSVLRKFKKRNLDKHIFHKKWISDFKKYPRKKVRFPKVNKSWLINYTFFVNFGGFIIQFYQNTGCTSQIVSNLY